MHYEEDFSDVPAGIVPPQQVVDVTRVFITTSVTREYGKDELDQT